MLPSTGIRDGAAAAALIPTTSDSTNEMMIIQQPEELKTCLTNNNTAVPLRNNYSSSILASSSNTNNNTNNHNTLITGGKRNNSIVTTGHSHSQYATTTEKHSNHQHHNKTTSPVTPVTNTTTFLASKKFIANNSWADLELVDCSASGSSRVNSFEPRASTTTIVAGRCQEDSFPAGSSRTSIITKESGLSKRFNGSDSSSVERRIREIGDLSGFGGANDREELWKNHEEDVNDDASGFSSDERSHCGLSDTNNRLRKVGINNNTAKNNTTNTWTKMVAAQEICEENLGHENNNNNHSSDTNNSNGTTATVPPPKMDNFDTSEELKYGPGIVRKLRTRFMSYTMRLNTNKGRPSLQNMRRATSLNNLLDDDEEQHQQTSSERDNHHNSNHGSGRNGLDGKSAPPMDNDSNRVHSSVLLQNNAQQGKVKPEITRSRPMGRGNESLKRARSVETLRYDSKAWERDVLTQGNNNGQSQLIEDIMSEKENVRNGGQNHLIEPVPVINNYVVTIEDKIINARERGEAKPCRLKPFMDDTERPPPDLVKTTLRKFEATANRRGRAPTCRNGEVAAKVASYKSIIEKPAILYPKPPLSPKKPMIKPRTMIIANVSPSLSSPNGSALEGTKSPLIQPPSIPIKSPKSIILQPNVIQRSPSPLTIRVDMTYRSLSRNSNTSNLLLLSPTSCSSSGIISPQQLTPTNNNVGNQPNQTNITTPPDLLNNIRKPHHPVMMVDNGINGSGGCYESPITQLTNKLKSMHLQTPKSSPITNGGGGGSFVIQSNSTPSSSATSSPVPQQMQNGDGCEKTLVVNGIESSLDIVSSSENGKSFEDDDSETEEEDSEGSVNGEVRRVNKDDLDSISSAGTTQEFKFNSVTSNSTPIKKSHLPSLNNNGQVKNNNNHGKKMRLLNSVDSESVGKTVELKSKLIKNVSEKKDPSSELLTTTSPKQPIISRNATTSNVNSHISNNSNHNNHVKEIVLVDDDNSTSTTTSLLIRQIKEEAKSQQQRERQGMMPGKDQQQHHHQTQSTIRDKLAIESLQSNNHNNISSVSNNSGSDIASNKPPTAVVVSEGSCLTNQEIEKNLINREKSEVVKKVVVGTGKKKPWQEEPQTNTMVFNFSKRKDVPDYIDGDGLIFMPRKRELPKVSRLNHDVYLQL